MRTIPILVLLMTLAAGRVATAQSFEIYGAAGPTIVDAGNSFAVGAGLAPASKLTLLFNFERTHIASQFNRNGDVFSAFRGGTFYLGSAEARFAPLGRDRVAPYGLAGLAAGVSRPNVNRFFHDPVSNDVRAAFAGGGVQIPFRERLAFFADVRWMFGAEGNEGIVAVAPVRAGVTFRF